MAVVRGWRRRFRMESMMHSVDTGTPRHSRMAPGMPIAYTCGGHYCVGQIQGNSSRLSAQFGRCTTCRITRALECKCMPLISKETLQAGL